MHQLPLSVRISGPAGYGTKYVGYLLQKALQSLGYYTFGYMEYPSLIRGGHNVYQVDFDIRPINSSSEKYDILIAMDTESIDIYGNGIASSGMLLYSKNGATDINITEKRYTPIGIPVVDLISRNNLPAIVQNSLLVSILFNILQLDSTVLEKTVEKLFSRKGEQIVNQNKKAIAVGQKYAKENIQQKLKIETPNKSKDSTIVISGNEAIALGFIAGKGKFYSAYPMTPSTSILHYLAKHNNGVIVRQAATEIEAIGVAIGASYAGAKSMVATSGGGLDLMGEFISMSGIAEVGITIVDAQRTGPGTGLPTWQEQSDLNLSKNIGHGEFPRLVIAPGDPQEAYYLTQIALEIAQTLQTPVIMLTDKHLAESFFTLYKNSLSNPGTHMGMPSTLHDVERRNGTADTQNYYRIDTQWGIPPTITLTQKILKMVNSDEHDEKGNSIESDPMRIKQQDKRLKKQELLNQILPNPHIWKANKNCKTLVIGWGSTKPVILDTQKYLSQKEKYFDFMQFMYLYPTNTKSLSNQLKSYEKVILVENNSTGQLLSTIKLAGKTNINTILKYDGKPFFRDELAQRLYDIV